MTYHSDIVVEIPGVPVEAGDDTEELIEQVVAQGLASYDVEYHGAVDATKAGRRHTEVHLTDDGLGVTMYEGSDIVDETWFTWSELDEDHWANTHIILSAEDES